MKPIPVLIFFFLLIVNHLFGQAKPEIKYSVKNGMVTFEIANLPSLKATPGAMSTPFYEFFWQFGDGHFGRNSKKGKGQARIRHTYLNTGEYMVKLHISINYADGTLPPLEKTIIINEVQQNVAPPTYKHLRDDALALVKNHNPSPAEELVIGIGYKKQRPTEGDTSGYLVLFYNETSKIENLFKLKGPSIHYGEALSRILEEPKFKVTTGPNKPLPSFILETKRAYRSAQAFSFSELSKEEERHLFLTFSPTAFSETTDSVVTNMTAVYFSDGDDFKYEFRTIRVVIEKSHDPNRLRVSRKFLSSRNLDKRTKKLTYRIDFQNLGSGAASKVEVLLKVPPELDFTSFELEKKRVPEVGDCSNKLRSGCLNTLLFQKKREVRMIFTGISLPGLKQEVEGNKKKYSKGYVKASFNTIQEAKLREEVIKAQAVIYMDDKPLETNSIRTRFLPAFSIGLKTGYNYVFSETNDKRLRNNFFVGLSISPHKPKRILPYPQLEFLYKPPIDFNIENQDSTFSIRSFDFNLMVRNDLGRNFSVGAGAQWTLQRAITEFRDITNGDPVNFPSLFADMRFGNKYAGAGIGFRYYHRFLNEKDIGILGDLKNTGRDYIQVYLSWKFGKK